MTGTDLEVEVEMGVAAKGDSSGATTVSARKFLDICRALPEGATLKIDQSEDRLKIRSGRSRFSLQTLPAEDFPRLDEGSHWEERIKISQGSLKALLEKTSFSMAQQDVRYFLNGVLLEIDQSTLVAVATDGHRLARSATNLTSGVEDTKQAIVPRKAVQELTRFLEDADTSVTMEMNPNQLRFNRPGATLITKVIDGKFPDYRTVMGQNLTQRLLANRTDLYEVLARTAVLTNEKYRGVRLELDKGSARVVAHNPDQEEASDEVAVDYDGDSVQIGFNVSYIMDALRALTEERVEVLLADGNSGCLLQTPEDESTQYLIMPMRL